MFAQLQTVKPQSKTTTQWETIQSCTWSGASLNIYLDDLVTRFRESGFGTLLVGAMHNLSMHNTHLLGCRAFF
jgi:hypothetical protein